VRPFAAIRGQGPCFYKPGAPKRKLSRRSLLDEDRLFSVCQSAGSRRRRVRCVRFLCHPENHSSSSSLHPEISLQEGGFFARFLQGPVGLAWQAFGEGNAALALKEARERIRQYRGRNIRRLRAFSRLSPFSFLRTRRGRQEIRIGRTAWANAPGQRQHDLAGRFWSPMPTNRQCVMTGAKMLPVLEAAPLRACRERRHRRTQQRVVSQERWTRSL